MVIRRTRSGWTQWRKRQPFSLDLVCVLLQLCPSELLVVTVEIQDCERRKVSGNPDALLGNHQHALGTQCAQKQPEFEHHVVPGYRRARAWRLVAAGRVCRQ